MKILNALIALGFTGALFLGAVFLWGVATFKSPSAIPNDKIITIKPGSSVKHIAQRLKQDNLIEHPILFELAVRATKTSLKAGEYKIPAQSSPEKIMDILHSGKTLQYHLTMAEGLTTREIIDIINADPVLTGEITDTPPQGSLLPETYAFNRGDTRQDIIARMQSDFKTVATALWENRQQDLPLKSMEEAIILASIVEKETGVKSERAEVAGVFINRLKLGMPLQSDPTTIYALTLGQKDLGRALTYKDLKTASPFNTYHVAGLPPTPICNPGYASLHATLNPVAHKYLYFVADGTGGHAFAKNLEGHNKNVAQWRKIQRARKN